jgi:phage gp36-like protein
MPYAVQADLTPRRLTGVELAQLTDDVRGTEISAQVVTDVLTEASGKIDSYCRLRYALPLQPSEQLKGLTLDIAEYLLFARKRRVPDDVRQRFDDAIAFLKDLSSGKAALDQPATATQQTSGGAVVVTQVEERFSDENLEGFI